MATILPVLRVLMGGMVMPIMISVVVIVITVMIVVVVVVTLMIVIMVVVSIRLAGRSRGPFPSCPATG